MKKMNSRHIGIALAAAAIAALTACGGGGDTGTSTSAADPIDKYMGTIVLNCHADSSHVYSTTAGPLHTQGTWSSPTKVSATKATFVLTLRTYTSNDCSGQPFSMVTLPTDGNTYLQVDGTETIGTQAVDKTTSGQGVFFSGISASTITINGVSYTGHPYIDQTPQTYKDLTFLQGNAVYGGDFSKPLDAQGYPTALAATSSATKQ